MVPVASVLLPVHNAQPFLTDALDSILGDRDPVHGKHIEVEVIAVDDGSYDGSSELLTARATHDGRLRVLQQPHAGIVTALNRALGVARADIVVRMDADDCSLPGRIAAQVAYLAANPDIAVCGTGVALHPDGRRDGGMRRYVDWLNSLHTTAEFDRAIWIESPLAHPAIAARRHVLTDLGGYRDGPFAEDYDLLLRLHLAGHGMARIEPVLYLWRDHGARLTRTDPRYAPATFRALKARHLRDGPLQSIDRIAIWGAGPTGKPWAKDVERVGLDLAAWVDVDPRKIGRELHGAPILAIDDLEQLRGIPILVAVGADGARELIRTEFKRRDFHELRDYFVVA